MTFPREGKFTSSHFLPQKMFRVRKKAKVCQSQRKSAKKKTANFQRAKNGGLDPSWLIVAFPQGPKD